MNERDTRAAMGRFREWLRLRFYWRHPTTGWTRFGPIGWYRRTITVGVGRFGRTWHRD